MLFFVYSRDRAGSEPLRAGHELLEEHWAYMDGFADAMIARGPTLAPDRQTATGSLHVLDLPSVAAAREFVEREPNNRASVYADHRIWVFHDLLGRTMWEFADRRDEPRFLVIARSDDDASTPAQTSPAPPEALGVELRERLIVYGGLGEPESGAAAGLGFALQAPGRAAVEALLEGHAELGSFARVEVHDWEFGGRR
jgi:uncharacterized protein YciI